MRGKNYAFVKFSTQEAASKALSMNGQIKVGGHFVKVMERTVNKINNTPSLPSVAPTPIPSLISSPDISFNNSDNSNSNNLLQQSNPIPSTTSSPSKNKSKNQNSKKVPIVSN